MKVYHISAECYPVAKVGGLGDVVGALPKYQNRLGIDASVIMPWYDCAFVNERCFISIFTGEIKIGTQIYDYHISKERDNVLGFSLYLVKIPGLLDRKDVYGYSDESIQFIAFQHALLHWLSASQPEPILLHCHDHHSGLIPFFIEYGEEFKSLRGMPTVGTVHNGQYQGWMGWDQAVLMPAFDWAHRGLLDWNGVINPLAALIKCCWAYTTVSEGYLEELFGKANGLEALFASESQKSHGIVNGIDSEVWHPMKDTLIKFAFDHTNLEGKRKNKMTFCKQHRLTYRLPLFSFIGRLVHEKGADLLPAFIEAAIKAFPDQFNMMILGSGDAETESKLIALSERFAKNVVVTIGYDESLSHRIYASSDFLLMPSRVEPCGLNQLYAMQYGTMPIVRKTGGLADTVVDISQDGYGISFENSTVSEMLEAMAQAVALYTRKNLLNQKRKLMMEQDFSWESSADKYKSLYQSLWADWEKLSKK